MRQQASVSQGLSWISCHVSQRKSKSARNAYSTTSFHERWGVGGTGQMLQCCTCQVPHIWHESMLAGLSQCVSKACSLLEDGLNHLKDREMYVPVWERFILVSSNILDTIRPSRESRHLWYQCFPTITAATHHSGCSHLHHSTTLSFLSKSCTTSKCLSWVSRGC